MIQTLYEHTCDQCGKVHIEKGGFNTNGNWISGWFTVRQNTSMCYGTNEVSKNFCSADCLGKWAFTKDTKKEI